MYTFHTLSGPRLVEGDPKFCRLNRPTDTLDVTPTQILFYVLRHVGNKFQAANCPYRLKATRGAQTLIADK